VQSLRLLGSRWESWRRGLDYYPEGELIWLEVDATVRQQTNGKKSLDDFCKLFHGGQNTGPMVVSYTFDDLVRTLNQVAPYDWATLLKERVQSTAPHAPLGGIERGGWKLVYNERENVFGAANQGMGDYVDATYSLGFSVDKSGLLDDVTPGSPAYLAGIGPGMKLVAVNTRKFSKDAFLDALRSSAKSEQPLELLVENGQFLKTYSVPYHGGLKNPHLERASGPDILDDILKPLTH
jgi:predicted metalloprotease with PDZ domain